MNLPDHVAVMPLPNAILFPRALLPLYIFEPRYRQMLEDCLRGERMFAIALRREDSKAGAPYPVAGVGLVRTSIHRADGTSNLILEGIARIQIVEYLQLKPYRLARVTRLESVAPDPTAPRAELVSAVRKLARAKTKLGGQFPKAMLDTLLAVDDIDQLTDLVSHTLVEDCHAKQVLLETLDVNARLERLVVLLEERVRQYEVWRKLQGDLPNDHVGHN